MGDSVKHLILPALALATIPLAIIARMTRSSMLEVMKQDYIRTAKAKGLQSNLVIFKHAFRNALLPIVTIVGLEFGIIFAGALLTETIFGLSGVGRMLYDAITARDFPIIQGFTVVIAAGYVFLNLMVDVSYIFIDPRINWSDRMKDNSPKVKNIPEKDYRSNSLWRLTQRRIFRQKSAVIGMTLLVFLIFIAIFAPLLAPYGPYEVLIGKENVEKRDPPCIHILGCPAYKPQHIMGIDGNVRDVFSRILYGSRISLVVGFVSVGFAILIGTLLGAIAGYIGGSTDNVIMRILDVVLAFPSLLLGDHNRGCFRKRDSECSFGNCDCVHSCVCPRGKGKCAFRQRNVLCCSLQGFRRQPLAYSIQSYPAQLNTSFDRQRNTGNWCRHSGCGGALLYRVRVPNPPWRSGEQCWGRKGIRSLPPHIWSLSRDRDHDHSVGVSICWAMVYGMPSTPDCVRPSSYGSNKTPTRSSRVGARSFSPMKES